MKAQNLILGLLTMLVLVGAATTDALSISPHTTLAVQINPLRGCFIAEPGGSDVTNATLNFFGVLPVAGQVLFAAYSVQNVSNQTRTLLSVTAVPSNPAVTAIVGGITASGAGTMILPLHSIPFNVTLTVQPASINFTSSSVLITANCA